MELDELYNLVDDPGERQNLIDEPEHADIRVSLRARLRDFFRQYVDPQYDIWREGSSKAGRIL